MKLAGESTFNASRDRLWAILNDPIVLQKHMPGCESLSETAPDEYDAVLKIGVAAIKGVYKARLRITDRIAPESYALHVEGSGKPGFVKGSGSVRLEEQGSQTKLIYSGDLQIGGLIARVGQRLLGGITERMTREFFDGLGAEAEQS